MIFSKFAACALVCAIADRVVVRTMEIPSRHTPKLMPQDRTPLAAESSPATRNSTRYEPVGFIRRIAALVYDACLLFAVLVLASLLILPLGIHFNHPLYAVYLAYIYGVGFLFLGWFWTHQGQTLGMQTWRIRLLDRGGHPITWKRALLRFCSVLLFWSPSVAGYFILRGEFSKFALLFLIPVAIDYLWCLMNSDRLALHDILSRTWLVKI